MKLDLFARTHQLSYHKSAINPIKPIFFLWFRNGFPSRSRKPQTAHLEVWVVSPTRAHLAPGRGLVQESYGTKTPLRRWWLRRWLLVGGAITILKHDGVRQWVSDDIPYMKWKNTECSKPPTSYYTGIDWHILANPISRWFRHDLVWFVSLT